MLRTCIPMFDKVNSDLPTYSARCADYECNTLCMAHCYVDEVGGNYMY